MITSLDKLDLNKRYTYADYLNWQLEERVELIVREYWIVHPAEGSVLPYFLNEEGKYTLPRPNPFVDGEQVPVHVFKDLEVFREYGVNTVSLTSSMMWSGQAEACSTGLNIIYSFH